MTMNEVVAFAKLGQMKGTLDPRSFTIATFALVRLCQFQFHRHSDWWNWRVGARTARATGEIRHSRHARGNHGQSDVRLHRGNPLMSLLTMGKSAKPGRRVFARGSGGKIHSEENKLRPKIALVLGSGLGAFADEFADAMRIPYAKIPDFPRSTAIGHAGQLVMGTVDGVEVVGMQGRVHLYEGYSAKDVAFPIRVFARMGAKAVILTNAAGGIKKDFTQGRLVVISRSHQSARRESARRPQRRKFRPSLSGHEHCL